MSMGRQQPHDKLFRTVFSDTQEAESFLRVHLPTSLNDLLDWSTLALVETSFVDDALRDSESDLLYTVGQQGTNEPIYLYLLFEHQSTPDRWMRFRLLKYMCRIWDESFKAQPDQEDLRPIVPLVFYQGRNRWQHSTEFADFFDDEMQEYSFIPRFAHLLIDQSDLSPDQIQGGLKAQVAQLLMMAAYHAPVRELLSQAARLLAQVARTGGMDYVGVFVVYLAATQERRLVQDFAETVRRFEATIGGDAMLTYAEELRQEGLQEGRQEGLQEGQQKGLVLGEIKGKIETIGSLLAAGIGWAIITPATGIDPIRFQILKEQLQQLAIDAPSTSQADEER
jgi:predicted transposase/invertase (TIGR01784 family)